MNCMPKVSVIVPVYGVEKYIERCAVSLFEQTIQDIEYIFVDDCSPDRSIAILESVIDKYRYRLNEENKTVKIERMKTNSGLPAVRQHGVRIATGDYIIHCDSDDWVNVDMYSEMYEYAVSNSSDLVLCDYYISNGKTPDKVFHKNITDFSKQTLLKRLMTSYDLNPVWSAMARRELYRDVMFPVAAMGEDNTMMIQLVWKADKLTYLPKALYYYCLSDVSITHTVDKETNMKKFKQVRDNSLISIKFLEKENIIVPEKQLVAFMFTSKIGWIVSYPDDHECKRLWNDYFKISVWSVLFNPYIPLKSRVKYLIFLIR